MPESVEEVIQRLGLELGGSFGQTRSVFFQGELFGKLKVASLYATVDLFGIPRIFEGGMPPRSAMCVAEQLCSLAPKVELGKRLFGGLLELGFAPLTPLFAGRVRPRAHQGLRRR